MFTKINHLITTTAQLCTNT